MMAIATSARKTAASDPIEKAVFPYPGSTLKTDQARKDEKKIIGSSSQSCHLHMSVM